MKDQLGVGGRRLRLNDGKYVLVGVDKKRVVGGANEAVLQGL